MNRYRRRRSSTVNPSDADAESGDLMVKFGKLFRCETPSGYRSKTSGELYPREICAPAGMMAVVLSGEVYWVEDLRKR